MYFWEKFFKKICSEFSTIYIQLNAEVCTETDTSSDVNFKFNQSRIMIEVKNIRWNYDAIFTVFHFVESFVKFLNIKE